MFKSTIYSSISNNEDSSFKLLENISRDLNQDLNQSVNFGLTQKAKKCVAKSMQQFGCDPLFIKYDLELLKKTMQSKKFLEKKGSSQSASNKLKRKRNEIDFNQNYDEGSFESNKESATFLSDSSSDSISNSYLSLGTLSSVDLKTLSSDSFAERSRRIKNSKKSKFIIINETEQKESNKIKSENVDVYINLTNEQHRIELALEKDQKNKKEEISFIEFSEVTKKIKTENSLKIHRKNSENSQHSIQSKSYSKTKKNIMSIYRKLFNKIKGIMLSTEPNYQMQQKMTTFHQTERVQEKILRKIMFDSKFSMKSYVLEIIPLHHEDPNLLLRAKKLFCNFFEKYAYISALEIKDPKIKEELIKRIPMIYRNMKTSFSLLLKKSEKSFP